MFDHIQTRPADLSSRAMIVTLSVRQWSGRKLDKRVTREINESHGASADAGRYNKALLAKDALADVAAIVGAARADHVRLSLPWLQDGGRILPADAFPLYSDTMRRHREAFESSVDAFASDYPSYVADARARLNGMFDASDYPSESAIRDRFGWRVAVLPMPDAADFRVDISSDAADAIRADIDYAVDSAVRDAMADAFNRLHTAVSHMAHKLNEFQPGKPGERASGIFRDSLVENVRELVEILPALNLTGDARLAASIDAARDMLVAHDADTLRKDGAKRLEVQEAAAKIADDMAAFMGA